MLGDCINSVPICMSLPLRLQIRDPRTRETTSGQRPDTGRTEQISRTRFDPDAASHVARWSEAPA